MRLEIALGVGSVLAIGTVGCGTYMALTPAAQSVVATTMAPASGCKSLGAITGKGGGGGGGYVSNEALIEYAVNDLRNQAAKLGATHVVYSPPSMGGSGGTTTSAMVTGEALHCEASAQTPAAPGAVASSSPAPAPNTAPAPAHGGCEYDTQCKGERVCVNRECVDPGSSSKPPSPKAVEATPAPEGAAAPPPAKTTSP